MDKLGHPHIGSPTTCLIQISFSSYKDTFLLLRLYIYIVQSNFKPFQTVTSLATKYIVAYLSFGCFPIIYKR